MKEEDFLLEMSNITKKFPGVLALDNVDLNVKKGTVHALLGENGAGKSTLMKVLIGLYEPNDGQINFDGEIMKYRSLQDSIDAGISMIHQELSPVPEMTVAENIFLGKEIGVKDSFFVAKNKMIELTQNLLDRLDIPISPNTKMKNLTTAYMQMVEIAKAISYDSKLIIMDEPTSAITDSEVESLFKIINLLRDKGVAIIYITHKMDEIFEIADYVTVLRDGKSIETFHVDEVNEDTLVERMVGREVGHLYPKEDVNIGETVLEIKNFTGNEFKNINMEFKKGEIVGLAGLVGAGRTEVMESMFGIREYHEGETFLYGKKIKIKSAADAIDYGIGLLTEDRKLTGCFLPLSVKDNMAVVNMDQYMSGVFINDSSLKKDCEEMVDILSIKTPSLEQLMRNLSGGNQQKALLARWLMVNSDILILDEPTRGIDVGAKAEIHRLMSDLAADGKTVIMISSELPEILGMSDRIYVMHEGNLTGELNREEASQEEIMKYATGMVHE
jgi:inositol transport system ATP-binding protein